MDLSSNNHILTSFLLFLLILLSFISDQEKSVINALTTDNHERLVFSQCLNQSNSVINPSDNHSSRSKLFQEFIDQSSKSKYYKTIVGDEKNAISGTFQCRNDLNPDECQRCVRKFPEFSDINFCGKTRIQLVGCSIHYQEENGDIEENYDDSPLDQVRYRSCSKYEVKKNEFREKKYEAFAEMERCLVSGNGFCDLTYESSFHVLAQCVGNLWKCDCGECMSHAIQILLEECEYSISGEVYMEGCFITYKYDGDHENNGGYSSFGKDDKSSAKRIAIVIGGLAAVSLGLGFCYFFKSCGKKKDDW